MSKNIRKLSHRLRFQNNLFSEVAATIQTRPEDTRAAMDRLAERAGLSEPVVNGTASFYDFLNEEAKAQEVHVCQGTACLVNGSSEAAASRYPDAGRVMCCGYCYQGAGLLKRDAEGKLDGYHHSDKGLSQATMPVYCFSPSAILTAPVESVEQLYRVALERPEQVLPELQKSRLRGRGGAGFDFAFKCQATAETAGDEKYIVCNADEGDPGAFSDRYLLEHHPHKVMAGMYAAGIAVGANACVLYIRCE